jgi:hypothetical protein
MLNSKQFVFHVWMFDSYKQRRPNYFVVLQEKTSLAMQKSGYCVNHLFLAPPGLLLMHRNTNTLYGRILDAQRKFSVYSVNRLRGGHVECVTWGVGICFLCCFGLTEHIKICNLRFSSSEMLLWVDLLPVKRRHSPEEWENIETCRRNWLVYSVVKAVLREGFWISSRQLSKFRLVA